MAINISFFYFVKKYHFMKKALFLVMAMVISLQVVTAQKAQVKKNPVGSWKFEAPYAPEGYNSGFIIVGLTGQKYSTTMSFTGSESKLIGEKVKAVNDSILFSVFLEGQDIKVMLKIEDNAKMTGKAVYSEGEVPLALTKNSEGGVHRNNYPGAYLNMKKFLFILFFCLITIETCYFTDH